ncbi:MAG: sulfite exporter TauE/SafE family protein [Gammaproteobacteria bacterium]
MNLVDQSILFVISLIANVFSAFSGGGAGLIQLPAIIFLGLPFSIALATHKIATVALGIGATLRHLRAQSLDKRFVLLLLICGLPGVVAGAFIIVKIPGHTAQSALGVLTIGLGLTSVLQPDLGQSPELKHGSGRGFWVGGFVVFLIGLLNGSLSSGTGLFVTLWLVRWFGFDYKSAVAYTLILVGMFWNGVGAATLAGLSEIHWEWLPALLLGSLLGGYVGAHMAITSGNRWIKRGFELVTFVVGLKLLLA